MRTIQRLLGDERVRFLLVGGLNTGIAFVLFVVIELIIGRHTSYLVSLFAGYVIGVIISFLAHRRFTFRIVGSGNIVVDFLRFQSVSLVALAVNTLVLPVLVEFAGLTPIVAQAIIVVVTTVISYVGHKFFSFRRARATPPTEPTEIVLPPK